MTGFRLNESGTEWHRPWHGERAHALVPQFAREGEQDRSDNQPDEAEHLEAAEAAHQDPDEGQVSPVVRDHGAHDLVAASRTKHPSANEKSAGVVAPATASCMANAATAA